MNQRTGVVVAVSVLFLTGGGFTQPGQRGVSNREVASAVPVEFKSLYEGGIPTGKVAAVWEGFPYDRIELERTACFGTCPVYRMTLFKHGRAEWRGVRHTDRTGDFEGAVSVFDYGKLCYLLQKVGFEQLPPRFTAGWTDAPTIIVRITAGGKTTSVSDYSGVGPIDLWAEQQASDAVGQRSQSTRK